MNVVSLLGRIGKDPEIRYAQSGMAICNFSLATSEKIKGEDKTQWHRCVAFSQTAELIEKYVNKGDQLGIEGKISYGSYDKDGVTMYTTDIIVNRIHFVGSKKQDNQQQSNQQNQNNGYQQQNQQGAGYQQNQPQNPTGSGQQPIPDDSIPF